MTKLLHSSDWHLGATFYGEDLTNEYVAFFDKLAQLVKKFKPEGLLISGDLFDKALPARSVVELFESGMGRVHEAYPYMRTIIIAGNHDSGEWLESMAEPWDALGISVVGSFVKNERYFELGHHIIELPSCVVAAAPYPTAVTFPASDAESKEDQYVRFIRTLTERAKMTMTIQKPLVLMAHCYLRSKEFPRYTAKDTIAVTDIPSDYAYVAMGHAHSAKGVDVDHIRYCGSPWPITAKEHKARSLAAITLTEGHPIKIQLKQLQNTVPLKLVPDRPREMATVLRHVKGLPNDDSCYVALNVKHPRSGELNERLFVKEALEAVQNKRVKICAVFWTENANSPSMTTLMKEPNAAEELRHNLLLPLCKQSLELYQTSQSLLEQAGVMVSARRNGKGIAKGELTRVSQAFKAMIQYQQDLRLCDSLSLESSALKARMQTPNYQWEERLFKRLKAENWLKRFDSSTSGDQTNKRVKELTQQAEKLAGGVWRLKQKDEDLLKQKEAIQHKLQTKEGAKNEASLNKALKQVKQSYGNTHRQMEMAMARLKEIDAILGTSYAVKTPTRTKVANLIAELDGLLKQCKQLQATNGKKTAQQALHEAVDQLLNGITGERPAIYYSSLRYDKSLYKDLVSRHELDHGLLAREEKALAEVNKRIADYRSTIGKNDPVESVWTEIERLIKGGMSSGQGELDMLQTLQRGLSLEEKGLNELYKALNKAAPSFDHTAGGYCDL